MSLISSHQKPGFRLTTCDRGKRFHNLCDQKSLRKFATFLLLIGLVFPPLPSSAAVRSSHAFSQNDIAILEPHIPVERELGGGQTHAYRLTLKAGQYLYVVVEQKGIDVALALFGPDQAKVTEIVLPDILQGPKIIHAVTELAGDYRLEVRSKNKAGAAGRYEVQITTLREATAADLSIPARQLAEDDYEINLKGLIQTGEAERLGDYYFTVLKK